MQKVLDCSKSYHPPPPSHFLSPPPHPPSPSSQGINPVQSSVPQLLASTKKSEAKKMERRFEMEKDDCIFSWPSYFTIFTSFLVFYSFCIFFRILPFLLQARWLATTPAKLTPALSTLTSRACPTLANMASTPITSQSCEDPTT